MVHIEKDILEKLYLGKLPIEQQLEVLEHISTCDYCAEAFANVAEERILMRAPANAKNSILHQTCTMPIQLQTRQNLLSKKRQLLLYSMKIGIAAACAILMIFTMNVDTIQKNNNTVVKLSKITNVTDQFTQSINRITNHFVNGEDYYHD